MKELKVKIMKNINILLIKILQLNQLHMVLLEKILLIKAQKMNYQLYLDVFTDYLIKTIYKLANSNSSSSITLKDVDIKDNIYIIKSEISDKKSSANLYWKVIDTGSSFKIIDVIVENTSYFVTKKSEFNKILRKNKGSLEGFNNRNTKNI